MTTGNVTFSLAVHAEIPPADVPVASVRLTLISDYESAVFLPTSVASADVLHRQLPL